MSKYRLLNCRAAIAMGLMCAATPALAECGPISCDNVLITTFYVTASGTTFIKTNGNQALLTNCTQNSGFLTLNSGPNAEAIYSFLLTAFIQRTPVSLRTDNGSIGCTIAYAVANR